MPSVRIVSPDLGAIERALRAWARRLVAERPEVPGVLLFGSLARGDHVPGSDADLIVAVAEGRLPPAHRPAALPPPEAGIPADLTV